MSKTAARLALLCAVVGLGASAVAVYVHYQLLNDPLYTSFCDVSASVSCTDIYRSQYSTVWGMPVAVFSAIWFALAALLSVGALAARPTVRENIPGYLFTLSTFALAAALYLAYVSVFILETYCPVCLVMDAAVVGLFVISGAATPYPMTTLPRRAVDDVRVLAKSPLGLTAAVLLAASSLATLAAFPREALGDPAAAAPVVTAEQQSELERFMANAPRIPLIVPDEGAKVLIVKFNDFQCPACSHSHESYKPILAKYEAQAPGAVRMVLKDYPLNSTCNPNSQMVHPAACDAAVAARLARARNRGEAMEEWLYTHQTGMTPATVRAAARDVGEVTDFDAKYASTLALVRGDVALGNQLGIRSTPTFFINGVKVEGEMAPQYFDQAIAYELQRATTTTK